METDILKLFKFEDLDDFFLRVGYGEISAQHIAQPRGLAHPGRAKTPSRRSRRRSGPTYSTSIRVLGTGDLLTRLARCCNPVPGDDIVGYVTRGEGVSVHRRDCTNMLQRGRDRSAS